jgi:hypothetical protein
MSSLNTHTVRMNGLDEKDDAIAYACAYIPAVHREVIFRLWCRYHRQSVLRSDLERLKEAKASDQQRPLF